MGRRGWPASLSSSKFRDRTRAPDRLMKRYFFHISNGTSISPDQYGLVLPDLPAALGNATEALLALRTSGDHLQEDWAHWTMEVRDEHDTEVVRLPFSEVIGSELPGARPHLR